MITIKRHNEVYIEDEHQRLVVYRDGSGRLLDGYASYKVEIHEPIHIQAAIDAGLDIDPEVMERARYHARYTYGMED